MIADYLSDKENVPELSWLCLDCKLCTEVCPRKLPIDEFMSGMKSKLYAESRGNGFRHANAFVENVSRFGELNETKLLMKLMDTSSVKDAGLYLRVFFKKKLYRR